MAVALSMGQSISILLRLVVEADESDGSFSKLTPTVAVVTNIDREHLDFYKSMNNLKSKFLTQQAIIPIKINIAATKPYSDQASGLNLPSV